MGKRADLWVANAIREIVNSALAKYDVHPDAYEADTAIDGDCVRLADELLERIGSQDWLSDFRLSGDRVSHSLRRRVAAALYSEDGKATEDFHAMSTNRQAPWLADADRVIPIVIEACAGLVDARHPVKPADYLIRREHLASHMTGLFVGHWDWECPIGVEGCLENCGSYGCGN